MRSNATSDATADLIRLVQTRVPDFVQEVEAAQRQVGKAKRVHLLLDRYRFDSVFLISACLWYGRSRRVKVILQTPEA